MNDLKQLQGILNEEVAAHERLLRLKRCERDALVQGGANVLLETLEEIEVATAAIDALEKQREEVCRELRSRYHLPADRPTLEDLMGVLPAEEAEWWQDLRERLQRLVDELRRINQETRYLIHGSLTWVNEILGVIGGGGESAGVYGVDGGGNARGARPVLVNETA